jgi:hypothetical protein
VIGFFLAFQSSGLIFRFWVTGTWQYFPDEQDAANSEQLNYFWKKNCNVCMGIALAFACITIFDHCRFSYHPLQKNVLINLNRLSMRRISEEMAVDESSIYDRVE